jgi:hypothetical protein
VTHHVAVARRGARHQPEARFARQEQLERRRLPDHLDVVLELESDLVLRRGLLAHLALDALERDAQRLDGGQGRGWLCAQHGRL